ncbi:NUDIX hydrolase [Bacillota bacterium LX-D]|nr:NUDIX hydrolase [Bacillota bacterium LX-D]
MEETKKSQLIYDGKIIKVRLDEVKLLNGKYAKREIVEHPGAAAIIALFPTNEILLVKQYRKALEKTLYELPAGKLEKGELPEKSAARELLEETGIKAGKIIKVLSFYTSPGFCNETIYLFLAEDLQEKSQQLDEDEFLTIEKVPLTKAHSMILNGQIEDAKTIIGILWLTNHYGNA